MGYLVPDTQKKINQAVDVEFAGVFKTEYFAEAMKDLIEAYGETDPKSFNENKNQYFSTLFGVMREFNLAGNDGVIEEEEWTDHFPKEERTQENFKNIFSKLWKSISIAEEYKKNNAEEAAKEFNQNPLKMRSVAEIYNNYLPVYDQILIEKDMIDGLDAFGRFGKIDQNAYQHSLRNLNLMNSGRNPAVPFTEEELKQIKEDIEVLNRPFVKYGQLGKVEDEGLFAGNNIKNSADLQAYIDKYETMLRDRMTLGGNDHREFAQAYKVDDSKGDTTAKLGLEDIETVNRKIAAKELGADLEPLLKELDDLQNENKAKNELNDVINNVEESLYGIKRKVDEDPDIKKAGENHTKTYDAVTEKKNALKKDVNKNIRRSDEKRINLNESRDLDTIFKNFDDRLFDANINRFDNDYEKKCNDFEKNRKVIEENYGTARKAYIDEFSKQVVRDIPEFRKGINQQLEELGTKRNDLLENPDQPQYEKKQQELKTQIDELKKSLTAKINESKADRRLMQDNLKKAGDTYKSAMNESYDKEKEYKLDAWDKAAGKIRNVANQLDTDYQNSSYVQRISKSAVRSQLTDICEAMESVKKSSFFQKTKGNSPQYTAMVNAIKGYTDGAVNAEAAYKACEDYLKLSTNKLGGLLDMNSKAGKIRKQSCVRMMELLQDAPDFPKPKDKTEDVFGDFDNDVNANYLNEEAPKERINYDILKASLASKASGKITDKKAKDAKAYSNLNEKLREIKESKNAENTKKTETKKKADTKKKTDTKKKSVKKPPKKADLKKEAPKKVMGKNKA